MPHSKRIADNKIEGQRAETVLSRAERKHDYVSDHTAKTKHHVEDTREFLERLQERIRERRKEAVALSTEHRSASLGASRDGLV